MSKKAKQQQEQPKTRYDRKMEARRRQAQKEKRNSFIAKIVTIVILVAIIGTAGYFTANYLIKVHKAVNDPYLTVGEHTLSQVEYDYYFNSTVNDYLSMYSYLLSYMGLDTSLPYDEQDYSEDMTWQDYFEQMTLEQLKQEFALIDDAAANNYEYDTTDNYNEYIENAKTTAKENSTSLRAFLKSTYGEYATQANIKSCMENSFLATAYYNQLLEDNTPTDEEINDYYAENQHNYDKVTFYSFTFDESVYTSDEEDTDDDETVDTEDADSDDDDTVDTENADSDDDDTVDTEDADSDNEDAEDSETSIAYSYAQEMAERLEAGEDFESLCYEYATDDTKDSYNSEDSEYSLTSSVTADSINALFEDWLYDDAREEGDITIISSESTGVYYVLKFVSKEYDDTCLDSISSTLASNTTSSYLSDLAENYEVTDIQGNIGYLSTEESNSDESDSDSEDSLLNTDIIE